MDQQNNEHHKNIAEFPDHPSTKSPKSEYDVNYPEKPYYENNNGEDLNKNKTS